LGNLRAAFQYLRGGYGKDGARLCTAVHGGKTRGNGLELKEKACTGHKKKLSHHEDSQGLDEVVQKGYVLSVLD